jgi:hypothetical protein
MRTPTALLVVILTLAGKVAGQSRAVDSIAVLNVVQRRTEAMRAHDARAERTVYAPDAVWINAFGRRRVGPRLDRGVSRPPLCRFGICRVANGARKGTRRSVYPPGRGGSS